MTLYIMRHGQTVWNAKGIIQGRRQGRLSKEGIRQTQLQAEKFKNVHVDMIFVSPLMRTVQTANIMNAFHHVKVVKDERIIEVEQGLFTGQKKQNVKVGRGERYLNAKKYGMERVEEIYERCYDFLQDLRENYKDKTVLAVTHGIITDCLCKLCTNFVISKERLFLSQGFDNAEIRKFEI